MKSIGVKSDSYAEHNVDYNNKDPKFKIAVHVWNSKYKNSFAKVYAANLSKIQFYQLMLFII